MYVCMYAWMYVCMCVCMYVCMHACMYACMCMCMCMRMCMCMCMYLHMYMYMYIYVYIYTYIFTQCIYAHVYFLQCIIYDIPIIIHHFQVHTDHYIHIRPPRLEQGEHVREKLLFQHCASEGPLSALCSLLVGINPPWRFWQLPGAFKEAKKRTPAPIPVSLPSLGSCRGPSKKFSNGFRKQR